eukprot:2076709-Amphidinium_carterae.1
MESSSWGLGTYRGTLSECGAEDSRAAQEARQQIGTLQECSTMLTKMMANQLKLALFKFLHVLCGRIVVSVGRQANCRHEELLDH